MSSSTTLIVTPFPPATTILSENDSAICKISTTRKDYPFPAPTITTNMSTLATTAAPQDSLLASQPLPSLISPAPFVLQPQLSSHPLVRQALASITLQHQRQERRDSFTSPQQSPSMPQGSWQPSPHLHPATSPSSAPVTPLFLGDPHPLAASFRIEKDLELAWRAQSPLASRDSFVPEEEEEVVNE